MVSYVFIRMKWRFSEGTDMKKITEEMIALAIKNGFSREDAEKDMEFLYLITETEQRILKDLIA